MIVGENSRPGDMPCNPTKKKQQTNHRSATKEMTTKLDVPRRMPLEKAMEWIENDELVEVTPQSIRLRKSILDELERHYAGAGSSVYSGNRGRTFGPVGFRQPLQGGTGACVGK